MSTYPGGRLVDVYSFAVLLCSVIEAELLVYITKDLKMFKLSFP